MHEQEVCRVGLLAFDLRNARGHWDCGNAGRADQRVDLAARQLAHDLAEQQAADRGEHERDQAEDDDLDRLHGQELLRDRLTPDRQAEEDGDDIAQRVLCRVGQTIGHAAFAEQVAQHQHADQRRRIRNEQDNHGRYRDGEHDLLGLGHRTELLHLDLALLFGRQRAHQRRLYQGDKRHIGIRGDRDCRQVIRSQTRGDQDSGRAVRAADNADRSSYIRGKAQRQRHQERGKNAELRRRAQQQRGRPRDQGAEVGHRADAKENQRGVDRMLYPLIEHPQHAGAGAVCRRVEQAGQGEVRQQDAERDRYKQQRLKLFADAEKQQHKRDQDHDQAARVAEQCGEARAGQDLLQRAYK